MTWPGGDPAPAGTRFAGRAELRQSVRSTIDECRVLADAGAPEGTFVLARAQSAGRGRQGHRWVSPEGRCCALSVLLRPRLPPRAAAVLTDLMSVAAALAVREQLGVPACIKRPNDLVVERAPGEWRKLGGVLVDTAVQGDELRHAIVSLGLNVALATGDLPELLVPHATSLEAESGRALSVADVVAAVLERLEHLLEPLERGHVAAFQAGVSAALLPLERELPGVTFPDRFDVARSSP